MRCTAAIFPFYAYCYFYVQPLWHMPANLKRPSPEKLSHVIATNIRVIEQEAELASERHEISLRRGSF
jgi:hypothetical protein